MDQTMKRRLASEERPWMKFYPPQMVEGMEVPHCTLRAYLEQNMPGRAVPAVHYYGNDISWDELLKKADQVAKALHALGIGEGDRIPVFLQSVPEFLYLLLAAEQVGAALVCRDNTLRENVEAVEKSGASVIFAHDFLTMREMKAYLASGQVKHVVLVDPCASCDYDTLRPNIRTTLDERYTARSAEGPAVLGWNDFLALGDAVEQLPAVPQDENRPLFCAYTSGSTGPSKQVVHSAYSMIGVVYQMNFYGASDQFRPTWLITVLPPCLVAVVVSMMLMPLASNKLLILDPFCRPEDVDLELMHYRPNCWPLIPMFVDVLVHSARIPEDYDLSHLLAAGAGAEAMNNTQLQTAQQFLQKHGCKATFTTGYGCSEAGSNITMPMSPYPIRNGNVGIPMPLTVLGVFKPGTQEELDYGFVGELCRTGPGNMLGYDSPEATAEVLQRHADGQVWLHLGDLGYITEDGVVYTLTRGHSPRFGGGELALLPMENLVADANVKGILDEFFVIIPDKEHPGCFVPYLYVVLEHGFSVADVEPAIRAALDDFMQPEEIFALPERPFFHFKTNRIGLASQLLEKQASAGRKRAVNE